MRCFCLRCVPTQERKEQVVVPPLLERDRARSASVQQQQQRPTRVPRQRRPPSRRAQQAASGRLARLGCHRNDMRAKRSVAEARRKRSRVRRVDRRSRRSEELREWLNLQLGERKLRDHLAGQRISLVSGEVRAYCCASISSHVCFYGEGQPFTSVLMSSCPSKCTLVCAPMQIGCCVHRAALVSMGSLAPTNMQLLERRRGVLLYMLDNWATFFALFVGFVHAAVTTAPFSGSFSSPPMAAEAFLRHLTAYAFDESLPSDGLLVEAEARMMRREIHLVPQGEALPCLVFGETSAAWSKRPLELALFRGVTGEPWHVVPFDVFEGHQHPSRCSKAMLNGLLLPWLRVGAEGDVTSDDNYNNLVKVLEGKTKHPSGGSWCSFISKELKKSKIKVSHWIW